MSLDPTRQLFAKKHEEEARAAVKRARGIIDEQQSKNREAYDKFYNSLALFSGGIIAFSITFVGFLKNSAPSRPLQRVGFLHGSWVSLLICLAAALFYPFLYSHYIFFNAVREYLDSKVGQQNANSEFLEGVHIVNLTPEEKLHEKQKAEEAAEIYGKKYEKSKRQERLYLESWVWCGRVARCAFLSGIILLILFALKNY